MSIKYENPLISRYASEAMSVLWGDQRKFSTWRLLWVALAEAEREMGLAISAQQVEALRAHVDDVDFDKAAEYERRFRHDVMAHVHAYGDQCPEARAVIHLGATSAFVTDNADLILLREALQMVRGRLVACIDALGRFSAETRDVACLGFTHLQPAQPTTMGKRACLWCQDLVLDLSEVEHRLAALRFRGVKGTTGTQASFLKLFEGDHEKVEQLDRRVARKMGFDQCYAVTGQTYPRKVDSQVVDALSGIAQSAHKFGSDVRLLASRRELEEPFEKEQVGSSAMAYKRNPMRSERMCALSRYLMSLQSSAAQTAATQWLERTLDDSANRRIVLPQAFLTADAVLRLLHNVAGGLVCRKAVIARNLDEELPFLATENILMAAVAAGGDRQALHERIRLHSQATAELVKEHGASNDLLDRLRSDEAFGAVDFEAVCDPSQFVGRAPQQVDAFLGEVVDPIRRRYPEHLGGTSDVSV